MLQYVLCLWIFSQMDVPHWCEVICWVGVVLSVLNTAFALFKGILDLK